MDSDGLEMMDHQDIGFHRNKKKKEPPELTAKVKTHHGTQQQNLHEIVTWDDKKIIYTDI